MGSIFAKTSFGALGDESQQKVRTFVTKTYTKEKIDWDIQDLFKHRKCIASNVDYYHARLNDINPASFKYLNLNQRVALLREMQFAFYVISARYHLDEVEQRKQNMKQQISDLQHCQHFPAPPRLHTSRAL